VRARLIESDPGLLRLRHAVKSVIAVAIAVVLFWRVGGVASLFAGISAAFLMQSTDTGSVIRQKVSMAATAAALMIMAPVGSALHSHRIAQAALLIAWAAAVFYARRFLQGNGAFTLFSFTLVLLSTALPGNPKLHLATNTVAFAIAYILRFHVWPPDERRAILDAVRVFRAHARLVMAGDHSQDHLEGIRAAVLFVHNLLQEHPELQAPYGGIVRLLYEALQSLRMLKEARVRTELQGNVGCEPVHESIGELALCRLAEIARGFEAAA
jgi:hypothetical protein